MSYTPPNDLMTRIEADAAMASMTSGMDSLEARMASAESAISSLSSWRSNKATVPADASTSVTIPTAVITLGLNAPTAAGLASLFAGVITDINALKAICRNMPSAA